MRRTLIAVAVVLLVLGVAFTVADRVAVRVAQRAVADQLQRHEDLSRRPAVHIHHFPFLTQAVGGHYDLVTVTVDGLRGGSGDKVRIERLDARAEDLRVSLSDALSGSPDRLPAERVTASALVTFADLAAVAPAGVQLSDDDGRLRVRGSVTVLGVSVPVAADVDIDIRGRDLVLTPTAVERLAGALPLPAGIEQTARDALGFRVDTSALPQSLALTGVRVRPEGLLVEVAGTDVDLGTLG